MNRKSSTRRTGWPIPVLLMAASPCAPLTRHPRRHRLRAGCDRLDDVVVARATAEIPIQLFANGHLVELVSPARDDVDRGHDHAGRAETALQSVILPKCFLHGMQLAVRGEPLDRCYRRAFAGHRKRGAG